MRWPWSKPKPGPEQDDHKETIEEARAARTSAEHDLAKIREMRGEVERVVDHLKEIRTRNHLLEAFEHSLRRDPPRKGKHA